MDSPKILVADDEEKIARMVGSYLSAAGYSPVLAFGGKEALEAFHHAGPVLAILDVNMPGADGFEVAREIRTSSRIPIVFLTARTDELDRIVGFELGADDYVSKPFSPRELVARVKAILRRSSPEGGADAATRTITLGDIELDARKREVKVRGAERQLTAVQFDILWFFMREPGRVFTRLELMEGAIGSSFEGYERTIDAHVKNIRKALGDDSDDPSFIATVRGVGYKFLEPDA